MEKIILYSTNCPKCNVLEKKLEQKNIDFTIIDCTADTTYIEMLIGKGFQSMPILQINDEFLDFSKANKWIGEQ
jgi:glutaredoxin